MEPSATNEAGSSQRVQRWWEQHSLRTWLCATGILAGLVLAMFGDYLFGPENLVLSNPEFDGARHAILMRGFGFGELRHGHLALWNPHLFSGAPFFGGFQSALLYPPNGLFLFLPIGRAVNWSIALHVFLAGVFMYLWAAHRRLVPPACLLAAVMVMFCGAHFLHIYAGHLLPLCTMVWIPLVFLAIDGSLEKPSLGWSLLGMFAATMEVLAGYPQLVFFTVVAGGIYCGLLLLKASNRLRSLLGLTAIAIGSVGLSAIQLSGIREWNEMVRSGGLSYHFATEFSFPPENLITLVAPNVFGDLKMPYWGRWLGWEMSLFLSVSGSVCAIVGMAGEKRLRRFSLVMIAVLLVFALGRYTPVFGFIYNWIPGFNRFRGCSKFVYFISLFFAMSAAVGFNDLLLKKRRPNWILIGSMAAVGSALIFFALWTYPKGTSMENNSWHSIMLAMRDSGECYTAPGAYSDPPFVLCAGINASKSLFLAGGLFLTVASLLWCARHYPPSVWILLVIALVELFIFARNSLDSFDLRTVLSAEIKKVLDEHPGDYRMLNLQNPNAAVGMRAYDIWGYDPAIVMRYAQVVALTQRTDTDHPTLDIPFSQDHPLLDMFRCRFMFVPVENNISMSERTNFLPHLLLIQQCRVLSGKDVVFSALTNATFNPRGEVILESNPEPMPAPAKNPGTVKLIDSSSDELIIEADVSSPSILLVTDAYTTGWHARALPGSAQQDYKVMPANWCLRAVPLGAGHHLLRMEYRPFGFVIGKWISIASLVVFCVLLGIWLKRWRFN